MATDFMNQPAAIAAWIGFANLGAGLGLMNMLTDCHVTGDRHLARRYVSSVAWILIPVSVCGIFLMTVVVPLIPWASIFQLDKMTWGRQISVAVWIVCALTLASVVLDIVPTVYVAHQEFHRANLWDGLAKLGTFLAVCAIVHTGAGLPGAILAAAGTSVGVRVINAAWLFGFEKRWLRPSIKLFDMRLVRAVLTQGMMLLVLQVAVIALYQSDKLVISTLLGPSHVVGYALVGRLFLIGHGVFMILLGPLWPAHGEAYDAAMYSGSCVRCVGLPRSGAP